MYDGAEKEQREPYDRRTKNEIIMVRGGRRGESTSVPEERLRGNTQ